MQYEDEIVFGALAALVGVGLALRGVSGTSGGGTGGGPPNTGGRPAPTGLKSGEQLHALVNLSQFSSLIVPVSGAAEITLTNPTCQYVGPGRDIYTYWEVKQNVSFNGATTYATVMASGIANVALPASSSLATFPMVASNEIQPCSNTGASVLTALAWNQLMQWPCGETMQPPFCGAPPAPNSKGDIWLWVFQNSAESGNSADSTTGDASPTCGAGVTRAPVIPGLVFPGAVTFQ